jgi:hypothetical protein
MPLRWILLISLSLLAAGCASKKAVEPQPQTIHIRSDAVISGTGVGPIVTKKLFNIVMDPKRIRVNGTPVKDLAALERLLAAYEKPVLTIGTHKCLSPERTTQLMTLAQRHTDTPIAYGSYGDFNDPECGK